MRSASKKRTTTRTNGARAAQKAVSWGRRRQKRQWQRCGAGAAINQPRCSVGCERAIEVEDLVGQENTMNAFEG